MTEPLQLVFLPAARADLERVYNFLAPVNLRAAKQVLQSIRRDSELLRRHPDIGRPVEGRERYREWIVRLGAGGYVMRYRVENDTLFITRLWHSREDR